MNAMQPGNPLDRFRAAVMADPAAQQMLAEPHDPAEFERRALAYAAAAGIALGAGDLISPHPAEAFSTWPPPAWLPVALDGGAVRWAHFAGEKPDRPFFEDSVRALASRPFNRLLRYRTALDAFIANAPAALPAPRGLIFHMSRCGSTLVSQMLGAAPGNAVLAEAEPFDAILQLPLPPEVRPRAVRAMAAALGRGHADYFLKMDAWHALALPLIGAAFPEVPWIFLYRDPVEILASHVRMPGRHVAPGVVPALDGLATGTHGSEHAARILAPIGEAVVANCGPQGLLVHYRELPDALFTRILPHFGIAPTAAERTLMAQAALRDAKAPDRAFKPDSAEKRKEAGEDVRAAARHLMPVYAELEAIRAASLPAAV